MTPLMEVEVDLLEKIKEICKKYNLKYYAGSGTLLGAVRHNGFIPWDDDIDVFLFWPDYKKLLEVAPKECQYPYFFQCLYTEKDCMPSASRLRRSDTTGFTKWEERNVGPNYDKGIFIDIVPLFNVPESEENRIIQKDRVIYYYEAIHGYDAINQKLRGSQVNPLWETFIPTLIKCCGTDDVDKIDIVQLKERYYSACAMYQDRTKEIGMSSIKIYYPNWMWETEWFDQSVELPFENTTIQCPANYEKILKKQYGDWRTPVKGAGSHTMAAYSTNIPWREFRFEYIG